MEFLIFNLLIIVFSFVLTLFIRKYTVQRNSLCHPNERSLHTEPTPQGGGLSIAVIFLVAVPFISSLSLNVKLAITVAGFIIALIGFWDDRVHVPAKWRLFTHFLASFWVLYCLGSEFQFQFFSYSLDFGWFSVVLISFALVWLLNLYNFMDGIDGIAATETIFVTCSAAYLSWISGLENISILLLLLAAPTTGFLLLNWPPAKIFMGDVGSAFLGLMIGTIAYISILDGFSIWVWVILLGVFLVDSAVTLIRRMLNGEKWYEAHSIHAYQYAAKKWGHKKVTVATIIINIFWLLPVSLLAFHNKKLEVIFTLIAYIPLLFTAFYFRAGVALK